MLGRSLSFLVPHIPPERQDWWIIGSAAAALLGADSQPEDIDLVASGDTVRLILKSLNTTAAPPAPGVRFRSYPYYTVILDGGFNIDLMGDMEVMRDNIWQGLHIRSRIPVTCAGVTVFVPEREEQITILEAFGRPKDLSRADLLRRLPL